MMFYNKIKSIYNMVVLLLIATLVTGCENESSENTSTSIFHLTINTKALNGVEGNTPLSGMRLVVVDGSTSRIIFNKSTDNGLSETQETDGSRTFALELQPGEYTTYIIANETQQMKTDLDNAITLNNLKAVSVKGTFEEATTPFSGSQDFRLRKKEHAGVVSLEASIDGGTSWKDKLEISLERIQCKVSLYLRKKTGSTDEIKITKVELCNIPELSYLISKAYEPLVPQASTVFDNATAITLGSDVPDGEEALTSYTTIFDTGAIFPEKKMLDNTDASKATYLKIYATYGTLQTTYTVKLRDDLTVENYDLSRNIHYKVYATLKSAGEVFAIYFTPIWTVAEVSGDVEVPYLNVSNLNQQQVVTKDVNGQLTPDGDLSCVYFFWTNRPASEIRVEWDEHSPDRMLLKAPVLTILKNTTTPDGVSDVAGKIEITVDKEWVKNNFHVANRVLGKACTLISDKLNRALGVSLQGALIPFISDPSPASGVLKSRWVSGSGSNSKYTVTGCSFEVTAFIDASMVVNVSGIAYAVPSLSEKNRIENPDGSISVTYAITVGSTNPRYLDAGDKNMTLKVCHINDLNSNLYSPVPFKLTITKENY